MTPINPKPGRPVPTLTEVVHLPPAATTPAGPLPSPLASAAPQPSEAMVQRVMQRVELSLEGQLREAASAVVAEQVRVMVPLLRQSLETAVRQALQQAIAAEFSPPSGKS